MNQAKARIDSTLGSEVSASLEKARSKTDRREMAVSRVRKKIVDRELPRFRTPTRLRRGRIAGALALAATLVLVSWFARFYTEKRAEEARVAATKNAPKLSFVVTHTSGPSTGEVGAFIAAPPSEPLPLAFSDGSHVDLAPRARARVAELDAKGARVLVESGTVHVAVVHREQTKWAIEAGPYEVRVTGTKFDVAFDPTDESIVVKLEEGSVLVAGCGSSEPRRVVAGEEMRASCRGAAKATAVSPAELPDAPEKTEGKPVETKAENKASDHPEQAAPKVEPKTGSTADVMDLAKKGSHAEAITAAEARGYESTCDALSAADLLLLADAGRYAGKFDRATQALEAVRRRFPQTDSSATAAFELGRIAFDARRDFHGAGDWFDTYLRERPSGGFAREALGRALEARTKTSDPRASDLAARYLAAYPEGPHAKLARKLQGSP